MLLALFILVPLAEVYLLFALSHVLGFLPTVAIVLVTGVLGAGLAKREGLRVLGRWRSALAEGRMPEEGVLDGLLVLVGGILLITPGVLTDVTGLLLLFPPSRRVAARWLERRAERGIAEGNVQIFGFGSGLGGLGGLGGFDVGQEPARSADPRPRPPRVGYDGVIDVEGHELPTD